MARILMVIRPWEGGAFRNVADLSAGLIEAGHEVAAAGPLEEGSPHPRAEPFRIEMAREISPRADLASARDLARLVHRWKPDLVHAHGTKAGFYAALAHTARPGTPLVRTPHGYAFAGYSASESARRRYKLAERSVGWIAKRVICVCEAERRLAASVGPRSRTRVVHNGTQVDPDSAPMAAVAELRERPGPVVGVVSGLRPGKGIETMLQSWPAVVGRHPDARLAIAGEGRELPELERIAREEGVADSVVWLGRSPGAGPVLSGVDLFVNPSWAESFPYAVLEAMAFGVPIVATDVGGTGEAVEDGSSGRLVAPRDPAALADAVSALLADRDAARALGAAAKQRHDSLFSLQAMIQGTLAVYREVLSVPI